MTITTKYELDQKVFYVHHNGSIRNCTIKWAEIEAHKDRIRIVYFVTGANGSQRKNEKDLFVSKEALKLAMIEKIVEQ